jgi:hypothetical protein
MIVTYCDLCGVPLKENESYFLVVCSAMNTAMNLDRTLTEEDYRRYLDKIDKESQRKEICPTCKRLFDDIFKLRLQNLTEIANELLGIWKLSSKEDKDKGKKNGKK